MSIVEGTAYCWSCRSFVDAAPDGTCPWCERAIAEIDASELPARPQPTVLTPAEPDPLRVTHTPRRPRRFRGEFYDRHLEARRAALVHYVTYGSRLHAGELAIRAGMPFASPESAAGSLRVLCIREGWVDELGKPCRAKIAAALQDGTWARTRPPGAPVGGRQGISEALIQEAVWLYFYDELSFRLIAERLLSRTTYKSAMILKGSLIKEWNQRGWPRRSPQRAKAGYTPPTTGRRCVATGRRTGRPCTRWAITGEQFCNGHHPDRQSARETIAKRASEQAFVDVVSIIPLGWWLRDRVRELGSVAELHRRIERAVCYSTLTRWVSPWAEQPNADGRHPRVLRRTIDALLAADGTGTTFEDIYLPQPFQGAWCASCEQEVIVVADQCCLCGSDVRRAA